MKEDIGAEQDLSEEQLQAVTGGVGLNDCPQCQPKLQKTQDYQNTYMQNKKSFQDAQVAGNRFVANEYRARAQEAQNAAKPLVDEIKNHHPDEFKK